MVFDAPRPRRRAWRWLIPLFLVVVALVALSASGAGSDTRAEIEYLNEMSTQLEEIALGGEALREVVPRLSVIGRPEWVAAIEDLRGDIALGLEFVQADPPTTELFAVRSLYRLALQDWDAGVAGLGSGVLAAADNPSDTAPVDTIANAIVRLRAGDSLLDDLLAEMERVDVPDPVTPFREAVLTPGDGEAVSLAVSYSLAARSADNALALRPGLAASQVVSDPIWQLNPDNLVVMPATEEVVFSVVVSNTGNLMSMEELLVLRLTGADEPVELSAPIPPLEPGAQTTISFDPLPVSPGETYEVAAEVIVADIDSNFEDNLVQVVFRVNSE